MCRQSPFGDFCSDLDPASYLGSMAWEEFQGEGIDKIKPQITQKIDCIPLTSEEVVYGPQDYACDD